MTHDMKTILTRMFTVVVLMMISMAARAIDVQIVNDGKFTGGTITATQSDPKDGLVTVTLYVTPNSGYTISKSDITVVSTIPTGTRNTRAEGPKVAKALDLDGDDPKNLSDKRTYTVTVDEGFGVWVQSVTFRPSRDPGAKTVTGQSEIIRNYEGTYYIANYNNGGYNSTDNTDNFYLCPAMNYYDYNGTPPNQKPYLTTHKPDPTNRPKEPIAKWKIKYAITEGGVDYYYIKYVAPNGDEKYIVHHNIVISGKESRIRYHLQADKDTNNEENNLFFFTQGVYNKQYKNFINICPKAEISRDPDASINPAKANSNDYYGTTGIGAESFPGSSTQCGGLIGHWDINDKTGLWFLEDVVKNPVVSINGEGKAEITSSDAANAIYKYSTDGNTPSTLYDSDNPIDITNVETIKAIAVLNGEESNEVTYTVGNGSTYLIQNQECTAYYMVPEQKESGNISINTSSVAGPKMEWYIRNAGAVNGLQYYYIVNKSTSSSLSQNYLYTTGTNIYFASNSDKLPSGDTYKFYFRPNTDGSYSIYPKGVMDKSFHKDQENRAYPNIVISASITQAQAKWKFIPSSEYTFVTPTDNAGNELTLSSESSGVAYYYVASVGTANSYIVSSVSSAATSTSGSDSDKSWMLVEATTDTDSWQKYYYIVSATTGKYMHFLGESASTSTLANAVEMTDLPASPSDNYKFVLARATEDNTYYIIPKTHYDCFVDNKFYCLINSGSQINAGLTRASKHDTSEDINAKWTFESNPTLFCLAPVAKMDGDGNVSLTCPTIGTEIYYTTDGSTPDTQSSPYNNESWTPSTQALIKAIAVLKSDNTVVSSDITLLNNPDVTLAAGPYTYKGAEWEPDITVSVGEVETSTAASGTYDNNINAGTATVTISDANATDSWYIYNVADQTFTISPAPLAVTANDYSIVYGDEPDNAGVAYSGFVNSETEAILDGTLSYNYKTAPDGTGSDYASYVSPIGTYYIIPYGLTSTNYAITFTAGELTVEEKSIGNGSTIASGFTLSFDEDNDIVLKQGTITLVENTDFSVDTSSETSKYSTRIVSGEGNYNGSFSIRNAIAHFTSDGSAGATEYSATFVAESTGEGDIGHALPDGITAYIIKGIEGNRVILEQLGYIPEGVPVLLLTNEEKNGFLVEDANSDDVTEVTQTQIENNMLEEVTDETSGYIDDAEDEHYQTVHFNLRTIYLLYNNEFVHNMDGYLAKGKVYLNPNHSSGGGGNSRLFIRCYTETGIDNSHISPLTPHLSGTWYTLDGRRLNRKPTQKGLYLCNGQKTVVN